MKATLLRSVGLALLMSVSASAASDQGVRLNRVMREKLSHSQVILEAVVTSNWAELQKESLALRRATTDPAWTVLTTSDYAGQTAGFVRALDDLIDAAHRHDLEAAPLAYVSLTLSCVQCHRFVARQRMAHER